MGFELGVPPTRAVRVNTRKHCGIKDRGLILQRHQIQNQFLILSTSGAANDWLNGTHQAHI
uniref:Uncharacterized protein n=1 Tax=Setaria italica TaxID=4555 RepID=K3ZYW3_SETIT